MSPKRTNCYGWREFLSELRFCIIGASFVFKWFLNSSLTIPRNLVVTVSNVTVLIGRAGQLGRLNPDSFLYGTEDSAPFSLVIRTAPDRAYTGVCLWRSERRSSRDRRAPGNNGCLATPKCSISADRDLCASC